MHISGTGRTIDLRLNSFISKYFNFTIVKYPGMLTLVKQY
jgi:hypothetical protein